MDAKEPPMLMEVEGQEDEALLEVNVSSRELQQYALIVCIIGNKVLNRNLVRSMLKKALSFCFDISLVDMGPNKFLASFLYGEQAERILREGPWNVLGKVIIIYRWDPTYTIDEVDFASLDNWVQVHEVPLEFFSADNARKIGNKSGGFAGGRPY